MSRINTEANITDKAIGVRLKSLRLERGLTQSYVASRMGITFQQFQKNETGKNRLSAGRLIMAANALGVPIGELFEGLQQDVVAPSEYERMALEVSKNFRKIKSPQMQVSINGLIKAAASGE